MSLFAKLTKYLTVNYNRLELSQPLFFKAVPGLRFDLQKDDFCEIDADYFQECISRMSRISSKITDGQDDIFILMRKWVYKKQKIHKHSNFFKMFDTATCKIELRRKRELYHDKRYFKAESNCEALIHDKAENIDFNGIFVRIMHADFNIKPFVKGEIFIINLTKNTVCLMYDDRGCDIVSNDVRLLKDYYRSLSDLILEVNRPKILNDLGLSGKI